MSLTTVLLIFMGGFILHRHASVRIAALACLILGALLAGGFLGTVAHNLSDVFNSFT